MNTLMFVLDVLIYICGFVVVGIGGYVLLRFFKGEMKKRKNKE